MWDIVVGRWEHQLGWRRTGARMTRYGYIGLGMMGSAMVENLIATGVQVTVHDIDTPAVEAAVSLGAAAAASPAEVAAAADVVSVCVPGAAHIDAVLEGDGGLGEGAHAGLSVVIHSTVSPDAIRAARDTAASWDVPLFDACVAGGAHRARAGTQLVLAGGVDQMSSEVTTLLDVYASHIIDAGPVGAGAALKIAVNVMTYAQFAAAATGFDLVIGEGVDPAALFDAWREIGQLGALTEQFSVLLGIPAEHITGDLRNMLAAQVGIGQKDLSLAMELGETRAGTNAVLRALHDAMPAIYNVTEE